MTDEIKSFKLAIPDSVLADMKARIANTRWPEKETVNDWSQGVPLAKMRALVDYWQTRYDWRRCEAMLNGFGQYKTKIDGIDIHFLHIKSPHPNAFPPMAARRATRST
jgi:epoxide hydrolase